MITPMAWYELRQDILRLEETTHMIGSETSPPVIHLRRLPLKMRLWVPALILFLSLSRASHAQTHPVDHSCCSNQTRFDRSEDTYFVTRPPMVSSFLVSADRRERLVVELKDAPQDEEVRIRFKQYWREGGELRDSAVWYDLYDDGKTSGDAAAGDLSFTTDEIQLFYSSDVDRWDQHSASVWIDLRKGETLVDRDKFEIHYVHINPALLSQWSEPKRIVQGQDSTWVATDRFIYTDNFSIKYQLQPGADYQPDEDFWAFEDIDDYLTDLWSEEDLGMIEANTNARTEVTLVSYDGEKSTDKIHISLPKLLGNTILSLNHELLHRWFPLFYDAMEETLFKDQDVSHHPVIFRNTSGFLGPDDVRKYPIICQEQRTAPGEGLDYVEYEYQSCTSYDFAHLPGKTSVNHAFNDLELFAMGLLPVDSVQMPIYVIAGDIATEQISDSSIRIYHSEEQMKQLDRQDLIDLRSHAAQKAQYPPIGDSINLALNFVGNKRLSKDEVTFLYHLAADITQKGELSHDRANESLTYFEATGKRGRLSASVSGPDCLENIGLEIVVEEAPSCHLGSDGRARVNLEGITLGADQILWDNGSQGLVNETLTAGRHHVSVKGLHGCEVTHQFEIPSRPKLLLSTEVMTDSLGTATVNVSGGAAPYHYEWSDPLGQSTATATKLPSGTYQVIVTDAQGCVDSARVTISITGVIDHQLLRQWHIYPNPADKAITIEFEADHDIETLTIYDARGQLLSVLHVEGLEASRLELASYPPGTYIIRARSGTGEATRSFVKR